MTQLLQPRAAGGAAPSAYFSTEHEMLRSQVRRFVDNEVKPNAEKWEDQGYVPRDILREMGRLGFLGIRYEESYGGSALDTLATVVLAEELGRSTFGGFAITVLVHTDMASPHLVNAGSPEQIARYLPKIIAGETIAAICITEPGAGSDVAGIRTMAHREGGHYVLNGTKMFITNGVLADLYFVVARTDSTAKGSRGTSVFIVERGTPGFHAGRPLKKHGWLSSDTAELVFEDTHVPAENLLGQENAGFYAVMKNLQNERLVIGAMAMGEAQAALALTLQHVMQRQAFGTPLWTKQAIRHRLAMLSARVEAARQLIYHCAWLDAQGIDCVLQVSMIKALCGELVNDVMYDCVQFHGGMGFIHGTAIERMSRDARVQSIGGGATEVMLEEVAKRLTFS